METLGDRIRILREECGMTQTSLAKYLGCGRDVICRIELNKRRLSIEKLLAIATYFNVTVDWLLCRPNAKKYIDEMIGDVERRVRTETFAATKAKIIKFLDGIEEET